MEISDIKTKNVLNSFPNDKILHKSKFKAFGSICRRQDKCDSRIDIRFGNSRKTWWEKEKMLFPPCFPNASFFRVIKSRDCVVKSLGWVMDGFKILSKKKNLII